MTGRKNFIIEQGATFTRNCFKRERDQVTPIPLTGMDARMQIRDGIDNTTYLVQLTSNPAAGLTVDGPLGKVSIRIGADVTATFPTDGDLVYDIEMVDQGDPTEVLRLVQGDIHVDPETTR